MAKIKTVSQKKKIKSQAKIEQIQLECVSHWSELLIAKFGLLPIVDSLDQMLSGLLLSINSYPMFIAMKEFLDKIVAKIEELIGKLDPVWSAFFPESFAKKI